MSTLQVANIHLESTANNRIQYAGSNSFVVVAGGANTLTVNSTSIQVEGAISGTIIASQAEAEAGTDNTKLMTPLRTSQAIDALSAASTVLLGTLTTTSGSTQTLSGLTLTDYKFLRLVFVGVSPSEAANLRLDGEDIAVFSGGANTLRGILDLDLTDGTFVSMIGSSGTGASTNSPDTYIGDTTITTASTSVAVSLSTGTFDAGSVRVYGVK